MEEIYNLPSMKFSKASIDEVFAKHNIVMKRISLLLILLLNVIWIAAQSQYDYYDDSAVAGGADRALNGILFFVFLVVGAFVILLFGGFYYKIKYWLNPEDNPEHKAAQQRKIVEEQRLKEVQKEKQRQVVVQAEKEKEKTAIDLGLSVLWADSNLYCDIDLGKGGKYSWGDVEKRTYFRFVDCKLNKKDKYKLKKILGNDDLSICGNEQYDASRCLWGGNWRLPLKTEIEELIYQCEWEWTAINGISGYKVIGKNGNTIFLPVTGEIVADKSNSPQSGFYWSGSANSDVLGEEAHYLYFDENTKAHMYNGARWHGMAIRPVWSSNNEIVEKDGFTMSSYGTRLVKCNDIEECHIPYGVKFVASEAFKDAKNIRNLYIPNSVEEIEPNAFLSLAVESVYIPKSVNKWGECAFKYCTNLKKITIEEGLPKLGISMFASCHNLETIRVPNSITSLPDGIFENCKSLKSVDLPFSLNYIGDSAFYGCEELRTIVIPPSVVGIQDNTFAFCEHLSNITIPEGVVVLAKCCFEACISITNLRIPASLQHIDTDCFGSSCYVTLEVPKGMALHYKELGVEGISDIVEYDTLMPNNIEELKKQAETYISMLEFKREQREYEQRLEMGIMTEKEWFEDQISDMMDKTDDYYI